ncbi:MULTISPECIES: ABC transporter substrate-binding protein [Fusobacterium]|uniref:ABC transporter substrate-binding protein n=1 Tax=Fusobacterium TaxID=848 RepID=UPI0008A64C7B|nr:MULTISPECIES: ABC transporter substrate-binding protein [Fusobacterium]MCF0169491.1 ABC transporter substrate-binding protein [Fusobacterium varium]OFL89781.1 iron(III) dicitrate-binding protein [Fusobacterium sp. HMSC073F01]
MKKFLSYALMCSLFILGSITAEGKIVTDLTGKKVEISDNIQKVAIVPIPWASLAYAVDGSASKIVGMHPSAIGAYKISILKEMAPEMEKINSTFVDNNFNMNYEELALLKPELVVIWDYQGEVKEKLDKIKIPSVAIKYGTLEDVQAGIKLLGDIFNKEEKASELIAYHKDTNNYLAAKENELKNIKRKKILYIRDSQLTVATGNSVNDIMINMAGGENVTKDIKTGNWIKVTMEQVMVWNPDIIILSNFDNIQPDDLYNNKISGQNWANIEAIKNKKVYKAPIGIYRWDAPCAETPLMIKWIAKITEPEIFKEYNIKKDIKDFYSKFFNYELSEEQLETILNVKINQGIDI